MQFSTLKLCLLSASIALCASPSVQAQMGGVVTETRSNGASFTDENPDVAYDPITDTFANVWQQFNFTTNTYGLWVNRFKSGPVRTQLGSGPIIRGTSNLINPRIAYIPKTGLFLIVWQDDASGNWDIKCAAWKPNLTTNGGTLGTVFTIAGTAVNEVNPDIAGDATKTDDDAVVVWDDPALGIRGVAVEVPSLTAVKVLTPKTLVPGQDPLNNNPAVSNSGGAARRIAMVWETTSGTVPLIAVQAFAMDLSAVSAAHGFSTTGSVPQVDGDGSQFVVVFQRPDTGAPKLGDIWCAGVKIPPVAAMKMIVTSAPRALGASANQDEKNPAVAFVGGSYLAGWAVTNKNDQFGNTQFWNLLPDCSTCGGGWLMNFGGTARLRIHRHTAIASMYNSDAATTTREAKAVYEQGYVRPTNPGPIPIAHILQGVAYQVLGGPKTTIQPACGGGGLAAVPGPFSFGEDALVTLSGVTPKSTFGLFVVGALGARTQFPCGTCNILIGPFVFGVTVTGGEAQWSTPIPCSPVLNNLDLDFQFVVATPGTNPCVNLAGLSASNILRATVQ